LDRNIVAEKLFCEKKSLFAWQLLRRHLPIAAPSAAKAGGAQAKPATAIPCNHFNQFFPLVLVDEEIKTRSTYCDSDESRHLGSELVFDGRVLV
jgi:hypothetical protein